MYKRFSYQAFILTIYFLFRWPDTGGKGKIFLSALLSVPNSSSKLQYGHPVCHKGSVDSNICLFHHTSQCLTATFWSYSKERVLLETDLFPPNNISNGNQGFSSNKFIFSAIPPVDPAQLYEIIVSHYHSSIIFGGLLCK